jgi:hypothetical protein
MSALRSISTRGRQGHCEEELHAEEPVRRHLAQLQATLPNNHGVALGPVKSSADLYHEKIHPPCLFLQVLAGLQLPDRPCSSWQAGELGGKHYGHCLLACGPMETTMPHLQQCRMRNLCVRGHYPAWKDLQAACIKNAECSCAGPPVVLCLLLSSCAAFLSPG